MSIDDDSGGARSGNIQDGRFTSFINWVWAALGAGVIGAVIYVGTQLGSLRDAVADTNLQVALARQQSAIQTNSIVEELRDHEERIRTNERDISTIQGRNLRGGPDIKDMSRGH